MDIKVIIEKDKERSRRLGYVCMACGSTLDKPTGRPSYCDDCASFYNKGDIIEGKSIEEVIG